jgi:hypothetical protein
VKSKVGLYLRYRTPENKQSPYRAVAWDAKKRVRPGWCVVNGIAEQHTDVTYHLRYKSEGKWVWEAVGSDANSASSGRAARISRSEVIADQAKPVAVQPA